MSENAFGRYEYVQAPALMDFYKAFHQHAYRDGTEESLINFTARSGRYSNVKGATTYRWAGLQNMIDNVIVDLWDEFFDSLVEVAVADYKRVNEGGLGVPCDTSKLEELHALGYMPLEFRALLEGLEVPYGVPAMTCRNTHPSFAFLPGMVETIISSEVYPIQTSLTTATEYMRTVKRFAEKDGTPEFLIPFLCHDFSMRGMMGGTMAGGATLSGLGHLMSGFCGSDTLPAALQAEKAYGAVLSLDAPFETIASVPATEHSVQCSFDNDDMAYFRHCMKVSPTGILSLVSDGYDFWKLVTEVLPVLKDEIMERDGKIVIRPDSGDPADVLCGEAVRTFDSEYITDLDSWKEYVAEVLDTQFSDNLDSVDPHQSEEGLFSYEGEVYSVVYEPDLNRHDKTYYYVDNYGSDVSKCTFLRLDRTPEQKGLVEVLYDMFGGTENEQGFKMLDEHIGTIYGDSITLERQVDIYERLHAKGFVIANCVLGVGSYSYQYVTRDTHGSAVKSTNMIINGVDTAISKEVKGDTVKKSAKGLLYVDRNGETEDLQLTDQVDRDKFESEDNMLEPVWKDGKWVRIQTLNDVRSVVAGTL